MRKFFKKTICVLAAAAMGASLFTATACGGVYKSEALKGDISGNVVSNGGFAVEKGDYIYYINGKQTNTADNTFGNVETGAIMRISKGNLAAKNYANVETVVPEIAYSGNNNAGLFIYGDYIYYSTPSAEKNSDGEVQNSDIVFKRAKLDGTETMKGYYAKYSDNSIEYRFVEKGGVVYLIYVAKSESLYGKSYTNIHSVNTVTGEDTLLAYNVDSVMFDKANVQNPRVYYTMKVTDYITSTTADDKYNQIYTVEADVKEGPVKYDFSYLSDYNAEEDPLYINLGTLVLDGIGMIKGNLNATQFNAEEIKNGTELSKLTRSPYTYTLSNYQNGTLFYTRTSTNNSTAALFAVKESELLKEGRKPAIDNPENYLVVDGSSASSYTYLFDDNNNLTGAFIASGSGLIKAAVVDGELKTDVDNKNSYYLTKSGTATILFTQDNYVYYSVSGSSANGYIINRLDYTGNYDQYNKMPEKDGTNEYTPVRILDLDCSSGWYLPEMFEGVIFFSSATTNMASYNSETTGYSHIMVCDINGENGIMTNSEIEALNDKYSGVTEKIDDVDESEYKNLKNAYYYAFYTGDADLLGEINAAYAESATNKEDEEESTTEDVEYWSEKTIAKVKEFVATEGDWADYAKDTRKINGVDIAANRHDYYYTLLGKMTDADAELYNDYIQNTYLRAWPEEAPGWFESLSKGAKAGFLIGVIGGGLIVIAAGVVVTVIVMKKRRSKLPTYTKKRIKVDTTDDKSVDVYATEESEAKTETQE